MKTTKEEVLTELETILTNPNKQWFFTHDIGLSHNHSFIKAIQEVVNEHCNRYTYKAVKQYYKTYKDIDLDSLATIKVHGNKAMYALKDTSPLHKKWHALLRDKQIDDILND